MGNEGESLDLLKHPSLYNFVTVTKTVDVNESAFASGGHQYHWKVRSEDFFLVPFLIYELQIFKGTTKSDGAAGTYCFHICLGIPALSRFFFILFQCQCSSLTRRIWSL